MRCGRTDQGVLGSQSSFFCLNNFKSVDYVCLLEYIFLEKYDLFSFLREGIIMTLKDWILLIVPICFNGIVVFVLQRIFEKRQFERTVKYEYILILRNKIDASLELHAKTTRLSNQGTPDNDAMINMTIREYVDSCLDVYYFYIQNKIIFESFEPSMENLATMIKKLVDSSHHLESDFDNITFSMIFNNIRDELMIMKKKCIMF